MLSRSHNARMNAQQPLAADPGVTLLLGASGGVGAALALALQRRGESVMALGRNSLPSLDYLDESSIQTCASWVAGQLAASGQRLTRLIVATGFLHGTLPDGAQADPERSWQQLDAQHLAHSFQVNVIGPALVIKHLLPLLPRHGTCVATFLSARVGSIGDNHLGGWYSYRAAKAALNQLVHTAAIELTRRNRAAVCVVLHPGTVDTPLSAPFAKTGLRVRTPEQAATELLGVMDALQSEQTGGFFDHQGLPVPW